MYLCAETLHHIMKSLPALAGIFLTILFGACTHDADSLWLHAGIPLEGEPAYAYRILDHWDTLDDSVERGYAGPAIWGWTEEELP